MSQTAESPVVFDPLEDGFVASPYEQYGRLRTHDPVHWSDLLHGWVLTRFDDANAVLRDPTISVEIERARPNPLTAGELTAKDSGNKSGRTLVLLDDPDHARLRKLLVKPFRAKEVNRFHDSIQARLNRTFDRLLAERGPDAELDIVGDVAYPLPVEVFCELLGVPEEDHPRFRHWTQCVTRVLDPVMDADERAICMRGTDEMFGYLREQTEEKRRHPTDDVMSQLVHAEEDGDTLSHEELIAQLVTLYVAGHEPTAGLISNGLYGLLQHPDQLQRLREDPALRRNAVSELLRWDGPNQFVRRVATEDIELSAGTARRGDVIYVCTGAANRDPERWGDTVDEIVVDRSDAGQHLQFGAGIHACLGSHLGRLQAELAFDALLDRLEGIELAGEPEWSTRMVIRGLNKLPIRATLS